MNDSVMLSLKGVYLILASGALHLGTVVAQLGEDPSTLVKSLESLGPQGLLLAGIVYLYRANQKLEQEIKRLHDEHKAATEKYLHELREQVTESTMSRDRLYEAIKGALTPKP